MVKKILLSLTGLIVIVAAAFFLRLYLRYSNDPDPTKTFLLPKLEMAQLEITSIAANKSEMIVHLLIKNQLPFKLIADSLSYDFYIDEARVMKSRYSKPVHLAGGESSWMELPVTVYVNDVDSVIKANERKNVDSAEYRIHMHVYTDLFFKKEFEVNITRYLPLIHLPVLKTENMEIDSLNFKRAKVLLHASMINRNVFDIKLKDYTYEVKIEDHEIMKGMLKGLTVLKSKDTTALLIPLTISFKEFGKTLIDVLKKGSDVKYTLHIKMRIQPDQNMMKNSTVVIEANGTVKSLRKTLKEIKGKDKDK